jgi:hypothetical protein
MSRLSSTTMEGCRAWLAIPSDGFVADHDNVLHFGEQVAHCRRAMRHQNRVALVAAGLGDTKTAGGDGCASSRSDSARLTFWTQRIFSRCLLTCPSDAACPDQQHDGALYLCPDAKKREAQNQAVDQLFCGSTASANPMKREGNRHFWASDACKLLKRWWAL